MTRTALPITSAGRFWPLGPVGIYLIRSDNQECFRSDLVVTGNVPNVFHGEMFRVQNSLIVSFPVTGEDNRLANPRRFLERYLPIGLALRDDLALNYDVTRYRQAPLPVLSAKHIGVRRPGRQRRQGRRISN
jgi:hypothetical protein